MHGFLKTPCYLYMLQFIYYKKHYTVSKCLKSLRKMSTNCLGSNVEKHVRFILAQHFPSRNLSLSCQILERCHACHLTENTFCSHQKGGKLLPSRITKTKHRKVDVNSICWNLALQIVREHVWNIPDIIPVVALHSHPGRLKYLIDRLAYNLGRYYWCRSRLLVLCHLY